MRKLILFAAPLLMLAAAACDQFYDQASVRPYERPQLAPAEGAVARSARPAVRPSDAEMAAMVEPGRLAYRRYCWPCHGPKLEGKGTVGPSFPVELRSLTDQKYVEMTDEELYKIIGRRSGQHPPMASTMLQAETWQVIAYIRAVQQGRVQPGAPAGFKSGVNDKVTGR